MKVIKESGKWLDKQIKSKKKTAIIFLIVGLVTLVFYGLGIIFIGISVYFFNKSNQYKKGKSGERLIEETLRGLSDNYHLINDVMLPEGYGNIDHIILGPNGIFVIETKNFEGELRCKRDMWYQYKDTWKIPEEYEIKSPSKQVKGNALRLRQFIRSRNIISKSLRFWVDGIVVFTHNNVILNLNNPTVSVLKINELNDYIINKKSKIKFSSKELKSIGEMIISYSSG